MVPGEVQDAAHFLFVQRLHQNIETTEVQDLLPQVLVSKARDDDDRRRVGHGRRNLDDILPIAARQVLFAYDNARMAVTQMESHVEAIPNPVGRPRELFEDRVRAAVRFDRTNDQQRRCACWR